MFAKTGSRTPLGSRPSQTPPVRPNTKRPPHDQNSQLDTLDAEGKPLPANFPWPPRRARHGGRLIATPRLEVSLTHTKNSPLRISNRDYIAVFLKKSSAPAAHQLQQIWFRSTLATQFLIYGPAIRNPRKP